MVETVKREPDRCFQMAFAEYEIENLPKCVSLVQCLPTFLRKLKTFLIEWKGTTFT